ncbi:MAG: hypothetical protein M1817_005947 [Caeruleum heppii]|nr:MAG: hypothetical protein M1817_005947 [Caeruleum heppii]
MSTVQTPLKARPNGVINGMMGPKRGSPATNGKQKANGSILNFFKKAETSATSNGGSPFPPSQESGVPSDSLFVDGLRTSPAKKPRCRSATPDILTHERHMSVERLPFGSHVDPTPRYNEDGNPVKRRKTGSAQSSSNEGSRCSSPLPDEEIKVIGNETQDPLVDDIEVGRLENAEAVPLDDACSPPPPADDASAHSSSRRRPIESLNDSNTANNCVGEDESTLAPTRERLVGPFVEDSDSEDETAIKESLLLEGVQSAQQPVTTVTYSTLHGDENPKISDEAIQVDSAVESAAAPVPTLQRESTSMYGGEGFEDYEDFGDDEYAGGEERLERRWMEEERRLRIADEGVDEDLADDDVFEAVPEDLNAQQGLSRETDNEATCPICSASLGRLKDSDIQLHVNRCLDGDPLPLPEAEEQGSSGDPPMKSTLTHNRFQRPPRSAKPGQANPFNLGSASNGPSSAFSKLMSSHAEDEAWATAAAAENAARGKPAYQRTCPFYKILPGFSICVDAFRYGAVEGCRAYFLSHFHSDHYVGLTSTWQHGPIYCSRVTANLVRQQLRVDPKFVVDLEFEQKIEVPGTNGVDVTMIPANHCPGSSLYLFEKALGQGKKPRVQRVLHCGDFRACPAHIEHPLLRPDLVDAVSGRLLGQQKIDVCYLDTTYLNPRYAFPSQEEVITSCADMCMSLKKETPDDSDQWEKMKLERAGSGMAKFVRKDSGMVIKGEEDEEDMPVKVEEDCSDGKPQGIMPKPASTVSGKRRGRLLVVVGTYSIGKERICLGIARALQSKIFAPPGKRRICACLEDPELNSLTTSDPLEAQVHMTPLFEIRAETLNEYLEAYKPHFARVVGFRPSGWNYRPPGSRFVESPAVSMVLNSAGWKSHYSMKDLIPQRGSTRDAKCFGVPYSEHSSFRELTMFCCALRIERVIPTVNVGSAKGRERMKAWVERWTMEKKKNGLWKVGQGGNVW